MDNPIHFNGPHLLLTASLYVLGLVSGIGTDVHPFLIWIQETSFVLASLVALKTLFNLHSSDITKFFKFIINLFK